MCPHVTSDANIYRVNERILKLLNDCGKSTLESANLQMIRIKIVVIKALCKKYIMRVTV